MIPAVYVYRVECKWMDEQRSESSHGTVLARDADQAIRFFQAHLARVHGKTPKRYRTLDCSQLCRVDHFATGKDR